MAVSTCQIYVVYMTNIDHFIGHIYGQRNGAAHIVLHDMLLHTLKLPMWGDDNDVVSL